MESLPSKMLEADQHLDRLGGILRSLRAPPSERVPTPTTLRPHKRGHQQQEYHHQHPGRRRQQEQQPKQEYQRQEYEGSREQDERRFLQRISGSSLSSQSRSCTASQPSQAETVATALPKLRCYRHQKYHQQCHCSAVAAAAASTTTTAGDRLVRKPEVDGVPVEEQSDTSPHRQLAERAAVHDEVVTPRDRRAGGVSDSFPRLANAAAAAVPVPPAPSTDATRTTGAAAAAGAVKSNQEKVTSSSSSLSLRRRVILTWWRGLSYGICFAAGAWAREGHGFYGAALALTAMIVVEFIDTSGALA